LLDVAGQVFLLGSFYDGPPNDFAPNLEKDQKKVSNEGFLKAL
jgi:hypothetical protein